MEAVKRLGKRVLYTVAPGWTTVFMSARARAHSHRVVARWGNEMVARKLLGRLGNRVCDGPFEGLQLTPMTYAEQIGPFLLGVYESELDEAWNVIFGCDYALIVDVGAKFGYYAVGLARRYSRAKVVAFDTDPWAQIALREMADANRTPNVDVQGFCSPEWLIQHLPNPALIVSDCEGYEATLFEPDVVSRLHSATLLIETHDRFVPGVELRLRRAFERTHSVQQICHGSRRRSPAVALDFLTEAERRLATTEVRTDQTWLLCLPHQTDHIETEHAK